MTDIERNELLGIDTYREILGRLEAEGSYRFLRSRSPRLSRAEAGPNCNDYLANPNLLYCISTKLKILAIFLHSHNGQPAQLQIPDPTTITKMFCIALQTYLLRVAEPGLGHQY